MKHKIDIVAVVIAGIALGLTLWQGSTQIEHNKISVEPRFNSYFSNNGAHNKWGIYILNNGMGTGFVKKLDVYVDGQLVGNHKFGKFYSAIVSLNLNPTCFLIAGPRVGDSFQVGTEELLIESNPETEGNCSRDKLLLLEYQEDRLDYRLNIESIYGVEYEYVYSTNTQTKM